MLKKIALLTTDPDYLGSNDRDIDALARALTAQGYDVDCPIWHLPDVKWANYDLVVIRSPWDYSERYHEFMQWLDVASSMTRILNAPDLIKWNIDKRYLDDIVNAGVVCVPYSFCGSVDEVRASIEACGADRVIIKPSVSAGSMNTGWFERGDQHAIDLAACILGLGKTVMVQPAVEHVTQHGENSLFYFNGQYSFSFHKGPILTLGGGYIGGKYTEDISRGYPTAAEIELGEQAVRAVESIADRRHFSEDAQHPLYARVDVALSEGRVPQVIEVELFEPAYFVDVVPEAVELFVAAVGGRV